MSLKARRPTRAHVRMTDRIATLRKEIRVNSPKSRRAGSGSSLLATSLPTAPGASGGAHGDGDPEYAQKLELLDRDLKRRQVRVARGPCARVCQRLCLLWGRRKATFAVSRSTSRKLWS